MDLESGSLLENVQEALNDILENEDSAKLWCYFHDSHPDDCGYIPETILLFTFYCAHQDCSLIGFNLNIFGPPPTVYEVAFPSTLIPTRCDEIACWKLRWLLNEWIYGIACLLIEDDGLEI